MVLTYHGIGPLATLYPIADASLLRNDLRAFVDTDTVPDLVALIL